MRPAARGRAPRGARRSGATEKVSPRARHARGGGRVAGELDRLEQRRRERRVVAGEQPPDAVVAAEHLGDAAGVGADDRRAAGQRLGEHEPERLAPARAARSTHARAVERRAGRPCRRARRRRRPAARRGRAGVEQQPRARVLAAHAARTPRRAARRACAARSASAAQTIVGCSARAAAGREARRCRRGGAITRASTPSQRPERVARVVGERGDRARSRATARCTSAQPAAAGGQPRAVRDPHVA